MESTGLDKNVLTHAVREFIQDDDAYAVPLTELSVKGFTVIESGLSGQKIDYLKDKVYSVYRHQAAEVGGEDNLRLMNDANIARALAAYDDVFIEVACLPPVVAILDRLFGPNYTLMSQNGIINIPNTDHYQFTWHRDLNYQHFVASRPLAVSALLVVDPFNSVTGGTYVLEGSHRIEQFPPKEYVRQNQLAIEAEVGSVIIFDSMLYHRTGANKSTSDRVGVNHIYTQPFAKQQYSFPFMLGDRPDIVDTKVRTILGYGFEPALDVQSWRKTKLKKVGVDLD